MNAIKRLALAQQETTGTIMGRPVLVVDDDPLVLEAVGVMLEELGCETLRARSGTAALGTIAND
ncbi:MAG: hypothetical protein WAV38_22695 [Xanthobacteraceae bacterium]